MVHGSHLVRHALPAILSNLFRPTASAGPPRSGAFHFATELPFIEDLQPGALGQFVLFPRGLGSISFGDRTEKAEAKGFLMSGFSVAAPFAMHGPWNAIGVSLSPLVWATPTGKPANAYVDRFLPAGELLGPQVTAFAQDLSARYCAAEISGEAACFEIADWVQGRLGSIPARHEQLIEQTVAWLGASLNPDLDALFDAVSYSRRQAERLVERYFGFPPAALARKFKAVRAAAMLAQEELSDTDEAELANAFHDQSHMIHEIRRFSGYTPTRLGGDGQPILKTLLQMKNYSHLQAFRES